MGRGQQIARIVFPVLLALFLFFFGSIVLVSLLMRGGGLWFWPAAGLVFASLWVLFRKMLSAWFSPNVFLVISIPIFGLFLAMHVMIPRVGLGPPGWVPAEQRQPVDLSGDFHTLDGQIVSLEQYQSRILFLNVWATWCGPCRAEMPDMATLYEELSDEGLSMVAVTDEDPQTVSQFLKDNPYPFTVLLDPSGTLTQRFDIDGIPTTIVIDGEGRLALRKTGSYRWGTADSVRLFRQLLSQ